METKHTPWEELETLDMLSRLIGPTRPDLLTTLQHIKQLAEENTKGIDGYEQIAEWANTAINHANT